MGTAHASGETATPTCVLHARRSHAPLTVRFLAPLLLVLAGAWFALHPLWAPTRPLTGSRWADAAIALVLLLRGWMYLRRLRPAQR